MVEYDAVQANCLNWPGKQQNYSTNLNILDKLFLGLQIWTVQKVTSAIYLHWTTVVCGLCECDSQLTLAIFIDTFALNKHTA